MCDDESLVSRQLVNHEFGGHRVGLVLGITGYEKIAGRRRPRVAEPCAQQGWIGMTRFPSVLPPCQVTLTPVNR